MEPRQYPIHENCIKRATMTAAKQTWHRPTLTFVSLQTTAASVGSGTDGGTLSTTVGCLEISAPLC